MPVIEWEEAEEGISFSTDKSNYSPRTSLPGTKLLLVVKTVNKWWNWGCGF